MQSINAQELKDLQENEDPFLLDVRTEKERLEWRMDDSLWIPLDNVLSQSEDIPQDRPVYVYCRSGNRSGMAIEQLEALGFDNLVNVEGGIIDFDQVGGKIIRGNLGEGE
ncbi:MAG: rhodanese-like domain-containing protein [bacterium]|nr:rhodanese-like domain-containing protein [bacterium]